MKNKFIMRLLSIVLISTMVLSCTVGVTAGAIEPLAIESTSEVSDPVIPEETVEPTQTPVPEETVEPTQTPVPDASETPSVEEPTVTPTPTPTPTKKPTATPKPTETPKPVVTPEIVINVPVDTEAVKNVSDLIDQLSKGDTLSQEDIDEARKAYDSLTDEEKELIGNYSKLEEAEKSFADETVIEEVEDGDDEVYEVAEGSPVLYSSTTTSVSNLHAGRSFYLNQMKSTYSITFGKKFSKVMDEIEAEYKEKNKISEDTEILVRNWQDILAIYVLQEKQAGKKSFKLNRSSKAALAEIFEELNPIVRDKDNILLFSYKNLHVSDYIKEHKKELTKKEKALLNKYTSKDCMLLCSTITAAKGFIRQSAGDDISEERVNVLAAAYSLVGKVGYFWGGKSTVIGWDSSWGTAATVTSSGSKTSGTTRAYGLDCSGFVTWAFINGYNSTSVASSIGDGTSDQWEHCETIKAEDAQPGDLVFQAGPENGSNNHVGILAGQTDDGDWIAVHCSSSQNGVTVGEAYSASFRYIRCPSIYPTEEEVVVQREESEQKIVETSLSLTGTTKTATSKKKQSNSLLDDVSAAKDSGSSSLALEN